MQSIEYNKRNHPILNQIYILAELQAQDKSNYTGKVPVYKGIKGNKEENRAEK